MPTDHTKGRKPWWTHAFSTAAGNQEGAMHDEKRITIEKFMKQLYSLFCKSPMATAPHKQTYITTLVLRIALLTLSRKIKNGT
ncbi:hypothetical protein CR164_01305 [Prosthecochloris marina]|uniref:Uncharacterized protein n=1 Tax=Prosthecochloris marina TaxID=2017681 RepID=A0A317T9H5_9CHLB|nr:hypothetical protein CR164_01305 [Prosthecochloris marina]